MGVPLFVLPDSREQEGTESDEGQLPQVLEELKDLQVAPGTRLAKFQLKVKGEEEVALPHLTETKSYRPQLGGDPSQHGWSCVCPFCIRRPEGPLLRVSRHHNHLPLHPQAIQPPNCTGSKMASH